MSIYDFLYSEEEGNWKETSIAVMCPSCDGEVIKQIYNQDTGDIKITCSNEHVSEIYIGLGL